MMLMRRVRWPSGTYPLDLKFWNQKLRQFSHPYSFQVHGICALAVQNLNHYFDSSSSSLKVVPHPREYMAALGIDSFWVFKVGDVKFRFIIPGSWKSKIYVARSDGIHMKNWCKFHGKKFRNMLVYSGKVNPSKLNRVCTEIHRCFTISFIQMRTSERRHMNDFPSTQVDLRLQRIRF